jgi:uncharacterized protein (TIGR00369 family)
MTMDDPIVSLMNEFGALKAAHALTGDLLPNCFQEMKGEFIDYRPRERLVARFPVQEKYLNPVRMLQGGFLTAAFDNVFGPLSYLAARSLCSTIDIQTHFLRGVEAGDFLTITGRVISRGSTLMHLSGEAHGSKGKLVATSSATVIIQRT